LGRLSFEEFRDPPDAAAHTIPRGLGQRAIVLNRDKSIGQGRFEGSNLAIGAVPYLLGFNYLVSYIERYAREELGRTVRAMIILDESQYHDAIDAITHYRRYEVPNARRLMWLVEFSYSVDSVRHPMIQASDLVIFLVRKFLEVDNGYRPDWSPEVQDFFAGCYEKIISRVKWVTLIGVGGNEERAAHRLLTAAHSTHRQQWRRHYQLAQR
jgi:uncharacterized protein DUF3800